MVSLNELSNEQIALLFSTKADNSISIPKNVLIEVYNEMVLYQQHNAKYTIDEMTRNVQKAIESKYAQEILNSFHDANEVGIENPELINQYLFEVDSLMNRKNEIETYLPDAVCSLSMYLCIHTMNNGEFTLQELSLIPNDFYPLTIKTLNIVGNGASSGAVHATF